MGSRLLFVIRIKTFKRFTRYFASAGRLPAICQCKIYIQMRQCKLICLKLYNASWSAKIAFNKYTRRFCTPPY